MQGDNRDVAGTLAKPDLHKAWIENYRGEDADSFVAEVIDDAIRACGLSVAAKVLDAGCGSGTNTARLAAAGFDVTGIDFSDFALQQAEKRLSMAGLVADLMTGDLTKLPFKDNSFDGIFCIGVLMHIPAFRDALKELTRVLKPGGKLVISETNQNSLEQLAYRAYWKAISSRGLKFEQHPYGVEVWSQTKAGPLVARRMNMPWLVTHMRDHGMMLRYQRSGVFTQLFNAVGNPRLKRLFVGMNRAWFRMRGPASLATGVTSIFEKG